MSLWTRISNALRGERLNREIEEELQAHIEEAIASGRDPKEARRAFGPALRAREASHAIRAAGWLESLVIDAKFGLRQLWRNKITSAAAVLSLALGIGSCVAAFRLIDALLWHPLPIAGASRLYVSVMWNWGGFASAICHAAPGLRAPDAADATMSWVPTGGPGGALGRRITPKRRTE